MGSFVNDDFLLPTEVARRLYHEYAEKLPVVDFHNHLDPEKLAVNYRFSDLGEIWIDSDPYKHRAMRIYGLSEEIITGKLTTRKERYHAWAAMFPFLIGNPLFHWSCLELKNFFGIDEILTAKNADGIWEKCNEIMQTSEWGMLDILTNIGVETLCTSDDILSDLSLHCKASCKAGSMDIFPSLRADSIISFDYKTFSVFIKDLSGLTGITIENLEDFLEAVDARLVAFNSAGCGYADHSLDSGFTYMAATKEDACVIFGKLLEGNQLGGTEIIKLRSYVMTELGKRYSRMNWVLQLHIGAKRNTNTRLRSLVGKAGGYAAIGSACDVDSLVGFLDALDKEEMLPRTILYTLNPADNAVFATITGSYCDSGVFGKVQFGPAWWYNDHQEGMTNQLQSLASYGLLSSFIGMTTDSRSVLSFSRHEYFRRILCRFFGDKVAGGEFPSDIDLLGNIIQNICYHNAKNLRRKNG